MIVLVDDYASQQQRQRLLIMCTLAIVLAAAYVPSIHGLLFERKIVGRDPYYALTRGVYPVLADACAHRPGTVLASGDNGHYIRFHTNCAVIANNFLLTPQHNAKVREAHRFMDMTPDELLLSEIEVNYVVVSHAEIAATPPDANTLSGKPQKIQDIHPKLTAMLLFSDLKSINPRYRLLVEQRYVDSYAFARVFEILPEQQSDGGAKSLRQPSTVAR